MIKINTMFNPRYKIYNIFYLLLNFFWQKRNPLKQREVERTAGSRVDPENDVMARVIPVRQSSVIRSWGMTEDCARFLFSRNLAYFIDIGSDQALFPFARRLCYRLWSRWLLVKCSYEVNWSFPRRVSWVSSAVRQSVFRVWSECFPLQVQRRSGVIWFWGFKRHVILVLDYFACDRLNVDMLSSRWLRLSSAFKAAECVVYV